MGWLDGLLTGYADNQGEIRRAKAQEAELAAQREGRVYEALLNSPDEHIRTMAATGILNNTQPSQRKSGFSGWMGEMQGNPMYPKLLKYMSTPQPVTTTTTEPGLPSRQIQGALPQSTLQVPGQTPRMSQPSTSPTEGAPMAHPQPLPGMQPPPAPDPSLLASRTTIPPYDDSLGDAQGHPSGQSPQLGGPPPVLASRTTLNPYDDALGDELGHPAGQFAQLGGPPPAPPTVAMPGVVGTSGTTQTQGPPGFPTSPEGTRFVQQLQPPTSASNGGWWLDDKGQQWTMNNDQIIKAGQPPVTPPPAPPNLQTAPLVAGPPVTRQTTTMQLPHAFPTHAESLAADEQAKMHAEISTLQEAYHTQGDPDWQKKGFDAYMSQHSRAIPGVMEGDSQPVSGQLARQLGVPDGTYMQPLYNKADGTIIHWIPAAAKSQTGKLSVEDEAAVNVGFPNSRAVTPDKMLAYRTELNRLQTSAKAAGSQGTAQGKYDFEKSKLDPKAIDYAARGIASDATLSSVLLTGRPQAFKDAVLSQLAAKGLTVQKLDDSTRSMATMAKDLSPIMDVIANDAKQLATNGLMDPISSRWEDFLAGKYGAVEAGAKDPAAVALFAKFRSEAAFLQSGVARAHTGARGAGSPYMLEHMDDLLSAKRMDYPTFINSMAGFKVFMDQYKEHLPDWGTLPGTPGVEPEDAAAGGGAPVTAPAAPVTPGAPDPNEAAQAAGKKLYTAPSGNVYVNGKLATKAGAH